MFLIQVYHLPTRRQFQFGCRTRGLVAAKIVVLTYMHHVQSRVIFEKCHLRTGMTKAEV